MPIRCRFLQLAGVACASILCVIALPTSAQIIKQLPTTGGATRQVNPQGINSSGIVAGFVSTSTADIPTVWTPSGSTYVETPLPALAGLPQGAANAINADGRIVGYGQPADQSTATGVYWTGSPGSYVANALPGSAAVAAPFAINSGGDVAGFANIPISGTNRDRAMLWELGPGGYTASNPPNPAGTTDSGIYAINDARDLAGYKTNATGALDAVVWRHQPNGAYAPAPVISIESTLISAMNNSRLGAGVYAGEKPLVMVEFEDEFYATDLPMPFDADDGASNAVNNFDTFVGYVKDPQTSVIGDEAALWLPTDTFWDYVNLDKWLDQFSPSLGSQWTLTEATGITDNWLVIGRGKLGANTRGFVLDVSSLVPEPTSACLMMLATLICIRRSRSHAIKSRP